MSDLSSREKFKLERLFGMESGYVLDFSNRTFEEFFLENTGVEIYEEKYNYQSGSKANRLREFWRIEKNYLVGRLIEELLARWRDLYLLHDTDPTPILYDECSNIAHRLLQGSAQEYLDAVVPFSDERDLAILEKVIRESLIKNEPEAALDRLHTFVVKYIRHICDKHGIGYDRKRPLHGLYGQYVKYLRNNGLIESEMTERILKTFISLLERFNYVRNEESFAHDNPVLNHNESELVISGVMLALRFLRSLEEEPEETDDEQESWEIPF